MKKMKIGVFDSGLGGLTICFNYNMKKMKIGVFDSGLGGLTILKELLKELPQYDYIYFGDNARVPYGGRSPDVIYQFTCRCLDFLFKNECLLVILACNTATSTSLKRIQEEYLPKHYPKRKVLGVIKPTVEGLDAKVKKVGVIGTYATINSLAFKKEIKKINPQIKVYQKPTPLLVPIIEENQINWLGLDLILKDYLSPLLKKNIDRLILGCTHYGLIEKKIKKLVGKKVKIINEGREVAKRLKTYFKNHPEIENQLTKNSQVRFFVTDLNNRYQQIGKQFLKKQVVFKKVDL